MHITWHMYERTRFNLVDKTIVFVEVVPPLTPGLSCAITYMHYLASDTVNTVDHATVAVILVGLADKSSVLVKPHVSRLTRHSKS